MKKLLLKFGNFHITSCMVFTLFLSSLYTFSQNANNTHVDKAYIDKCIIEVFQDQANDLVFNANSRRLAIITDFLKERVKVEYRPEFAGKGFELISSVGLNNKYNPSLVIDTNYNPNTFNPLKYKFPMHPKSKEMFRIDNTDYIITIFPSK